MTPLFQPTIPDQIKPYLDQVQKLVSAARELFLTIPPSTLIRAIVTLAVLILILALLKQVFGGGRGVPRTLRREARRHKRQGQYHQAGELFEMAGNYEDAAEMYRRSESYRSLGHLYELTKDWPASASAYEASGNIDKASQIYQRVGQYHKAAEILLVAKRETSAAEMFERAGNCSEAARLYERSGYLEKAGACYEQNQDYLKAAELYEKYYLQEKVRSNLPSISPDASQRTRLGSYASQSGRLYMKAGSLDKAARIFAMSGSMDEAAEAFAAMKDYAKAAELYHASKQYRKAADLYQQIDQSQKAFQVLGEMYLDENNYLEAARMHEKASDFLQAGELYERADQTTKAAEMYQKGGDLSQANELYQSSGDFLSAAKVLEESKRYREAAHQYIQVGEYERAALLFEEIGDFYEAGMIFYRLGRIEDTIAFLQKVDTQSIHYNEASLLLGSIFMERGMLDTAKERFKKLVSRKDISADNIEPFYHLALIYEKNRELSNALFLYEKIMAENYRYKDVQERIRVLKEAVRQEKAPSESHKPGKAGVSKGRYRILQKVGQGGMGVVYQAEDTLLDRIVAYKVLPASLHDHPSMLEYFLREARVAAGINHINVVTIYDTGTEGDEPYIIMEFVYGISLKEVLERTSFMAVQDIVEVTTQVCRGLEHAHSKNVVHRDIKPANIMIRKDRIVKIMDFGLAKVLTAATLEGTTLKGTPLYISPEQIRGQRVDHRTDIYSLGCTLYKMAAGRPPFTKGDMYYHHLNTPPPPPRSTNPRIPEALNQIILKCLEKDPARRYQTAGGIREDIEAKL